jgi:hypothetical protein
MNTQPCDLSYSLPAMRKSVDQSVVATATVAETAASAGSAGYRLLASDKYAQVY